MLKFLKTQSPKINQDTFVKKFTGKRILVMGSGPSVNLVNWKALDLDGIVTTSFFYLNSEVRKLNNIVHITLTDIVDLEHPNLIEFLDNNPDCTIAFEPKPHPFYESQSYRDFNTKYSKQVISYNTIYGKKEGVAGRACYFVMQFSPSKLYYVGIDGKSSNPDTDPHNAFRTEFRGDADGYPQQEFVESHMYFADILYQTSTQTGTRLYNLGEGFNFNCSTPYSTAHFPLDTVTKQTIQL